MRLPLFFIVALGCLAAACVPNKMYRPHAPGSGQRPGEEYFAYEKLTGQQFDPTESNALTSTYEYRLGFVEFDDRGEMFKRDQLRRAVAEIHKAKADAKAADTVAIVAVFVHGWKNNASESSGNVWGFRQVLAGLSKQFGKRPLVGIYVGWRGAVLSPPIIKELTFFDRQQKSQNISGGHVVEALLKIAQAAKGVDYGESRDAAARTVMIGHSFGGAVLETALTQTLVGLAIQAKAASQPMRWPVDLTLLVNEAQEASRSYQLLEAFRENLPERESWMTTKPKDDCPSPAIVAKEVQQGGKIVRPRDAPAIVSISSTGDTATRVAYKAAQALQRPFNSLRTYDGGDPNAFGLKRQTPMFLNTTAHLGEFQSHVMGRCECRAGVCSKCEDPQVETARNTCGAPIVTSVGSVSPLPYVIAEKPQTKNRTPYWVLQMPPAVVSDHSTIFTPAFRDVIVTLFCNTTLEVRSGSIESMCGGGQ